MSPSPSQHTILMIHTYFHNHHILLYYRKCNDERIKLDRRRFEEAHLRFAVLRVKSSYPDEFSHNTVLPNIQETLKEITPKYFQLFRHLYGSMYKCISFTPAPDILIPLLRMVILNSFYVSCHGNSQKYAAINI